MNFRYTFWWIFGLALIVAGAVQGVLSGWQENIGGAGLIVSGLVVIMVLVGRGRRLQEGPLQDERTRKIGAWGLSYSWFLTFLLIAILFWVQYLRIWVLDVNTVLLILILFMGASARLLQWYFFRGEDVT